MGFWRSAADALLVLAEGTIRLRRSRGGGLTSVLLRHLP
jgi:hypothetical protein